MKLSKECIQLSKSNIGDPCPRLKICETGGPSKHGGGLAAVCTSHVLVLHLGRTDNHQFLCEKKMLKVFLETSSKHRNEKRFLLVLEAGLWILKRS